MMKEKWEVGINDRENRDNAYMVYVAEGHTVIAICDKANWGTGTKAERLANAHLIAVSPRMAELLQRLVKDGWSASISTEAQEIIQSLDLMELAKAEGK